VTFEVRLTTPMVAYSTMVANMNRCPIHKRGMPSVSSTVRVSRKPAKQTQNQA
jgi:hypothetical protein